MRAGKVPKWKQKLHQEKPNKQVSDEVKGDLSFGKNQEKDLQIEQKSFGLSIHTKSHSQSEILLSQEVFQEYFNEAFENPICTVFVVIKQGETQIILRVDSEVLRSQRSEISLIKEICDVHGLKENQPISIKKVLQVNTQTKPGVKKIQQPSSAELEKFVINQVEVCFKDQFVSRRDMWKITQQLDNHHAYKGQKLEINGIRIILRDLYKGPESTEVLNGIIDNQNTKYAFFSKSSQIQILIEASSNLWEFDHNGHLQTEKAIAFIRSFFERCIKKSNSNEISIVVYGRLYYPQVKNESQLKEELKKHFEYTKSIKSNVVNDLGAFLKSQHVKFFQDVYMKVGVFEVSKLHQEKSIAAVKRVLNYFPSIVNWNIKCPEYVQQMKAAYTQDSFCEQKFPTNKSQFIECQLGSADKSNILEAINLCLFNLNNENIDQNLRKTGQQMIILTAGVGFYRVNADIINPTKSRCLLGGTPIQIISLTQRPPFQTPLLYRCCTYKNPFETKNQLHSSHVQIKQKLPTQAKSNFSHSYSISAGKFSLQHKFGTPTSIKERSPIDQIRPLGKRILEFSHDLDLDEESAAQSKTLGNQALADETNSLGSMFDQSDENDENAIGNLKCDQIEEDSVHSEEDGVQKQKYFFTNWMEIVYLFDLRLIESNLYLQAVQNPHGSDLAQQEDSYNILDKCYTMSKEKIVPNPYYGFLSKLKKENEEDNQKLTESKEIIEVQADKNWQEMFEDPIQAHQHMTMMQNVQQKDIVLQVSNLGQQHSSQYVNFSNVQNKIQNLQKYFNQHDQQAGAAIEFGKAESSAILSNPIQSPSAEKQMTYQEASKTALNDLSYSMNHHEGPKTILETFQQKIKIKSKNFIPIAGILPDITEDSANEALNNDTSSVEQPRPRYKTKSTKKVTILKRQSTDLNIIYEGTDFTNSEAQSPIRDYSASKVFESDQQNEKKAKLMLMIQTDGRQQELENGSQMDDNEVSEVNDYQSEQIRKNHLRGQDSDSSASLNDDPKIARNNACSSSDIFSDFQFGNQNVIKSTKSLIKERRIFNQDLKYRFKIMISSMEYLNSQRIFGQKEKSNSIHYVSQEKLYKLQNYKFLKYEQRSFKISQNQPLTIQNVMGMDKRVSQPLNDFQRKESMIEGKSYLTPNKRRWAHSYSSIKHLNHNFYTNQEIIELLQLPLSRAKHAQVIENVYSNFWKNICECRLLPLTIDFFPEPRELNSKKYYKNEAKMIPRPINPVSLVPTDIQYLEEFLCLRLSQNMQFYSANAMCHFDNQLFLQKREKMKMGISHMHHTLDFSDSEMKYFFEAWVSLQHNIKDEMSAHFKYLLFNYYENNFKIKISQESRMFNFRSLLNMEEVIEDFSLIGESLIKVPQISFILIPNKNKFDSQEQLEELIQNFKKFQNSIVALVTKDNQSQINKLASKKIQIQNVQILQKSEPEEESQQYFDNFETYEEFQEKNADLQKFNYLNKLLCNCQQKFMLLSQLEKMNENPDLKPIKQQTKGPQYLRSTIFCENYGQMPQNIQSNTQIKRNQNVQPISGGYLLECDQIYDPSFSPCFYIKIQWIFATCVQIQDSVKSLQRRAKESDFELIQISDVAQKQELNPFEISTPLRGPSVISYDLTKLNNVISKGKRLEKDIKDLLIVNAQEPVIDFQKLEEKLGSMQATPALSSGRRIRIYSDELIGQQNEQFKKQNEMQMTDQLDREQVAKQIIEKDHPKVEMLDIELQSNDYTPKWVQTADEPLKSSKQGTHIDTPKQIFKTGHSEYSRSINKSQISIGSSTLLKINLESFSCKDLITLQKYLQDCLYIQEDHIPDIEICKKLKKLNEVQCRQINQIIELLDLIKKVIVQKLFNAHFKQFIQNELQFFVLKKQIDNQQTLTTFIQKSGICLLTLNEHSNEIIWLENDVVSNSFTIPQSPTQNLKPQDPSKIIKVDKDIYNIGNNHYQISYQQLQKVQGAIFALDILIEIIVKI